MQIIEDPSRVLPSVAAAMIWLGLDPTDMNALEENKSSIMDCGMYLSQAAENGELRYYDKELLHETAVENNQRTKKVFSYFFTMQSLMDFARSKNHRLEARNREKKAGMAGKPLATTERTTLLIIIAALCKHSAIDPQERGAAGRIAKLTEEIGAAVTDDTVRKVLANISDALESRMK